MVTADRATAAIRKLLPSLDRLLVGSALLALKSCDIPSALDPVLSFINLCRASLVQSIGDLVLLFVN